MAVLFMRNKNMQYDPALMAESPKFPRLIGNRGRRTRWWVGDARF